MSNKKIYYSLGLISITLIGSQYFTYNSGATLSEIVPAMLNKDQQLFTKLIIYSTLLTLASGTCSSLVKSTSSYFSYCLRYRLLLYFQLNFKLNPHDFDQRWSQDLELMCDKLGLILSVLLPSPFIILFYWIKSAEITGFYAPLIILTYVFVSTIMAGIAGNKLPQLTYMKEKYEGHLRRLLLHIKSNSELIQFYGGTRPEMDALNTPIHTLKQSHFKKIIFTGIVDNWTTWVAYLGGLVPYLCIAIPLFNGEYDGLPMDQLSGKIQLSSFLLMMLMNSFTQLLQSAAIVLEFIGYFNRVKESINLFKADNKISTKSEFKPDQFGFENCSLNFQHVSILDTISLILYKNNTILLRGPNGSGKTSLLRMLRQLLPEATGTLIYPLNSSWMIVPSTPYFIEGSILSNIIYPLTVTNAIQESDINDILKMVNLLLPLQKDQTLSTLLPLDYYYSLSNGEQQLLCICRVLFYKPDYLMMDESLSGLDEQTIKLVYNLLTQMQCTYLTISHSRDLEKYHSTIKELQ